MRPQHTVKNEFNLPLVTIVASQCSGGGSSMRLGGLKDLHAAEGSA